MGCGASARGAQYAVQESPPAPGTTYSEIEYFSTTDQSPRGTKKTVAFSDDTELGPGIDPLELSVLVVCIATRPDWRKADYLVFSERRKEQTDDYGGWQAPQAPDAFAGGPSSKSVKFTSWRGAQSSCANGTTTWAQSRRTNGTSGKSFKTRNKPKEMEKCGNFYSRTKGTVGTWKINGNALDLRWGGFKDGAISSEDPRKWANEQSAFKIEVLEPRATPHWFLPDVLAKKRFAESMAQTAFECPVCFFELWRQHPAIMRKNSRRSCGHYIHHMCGQFVLQSVRGTGMESLCPICAQPFNEVKAMPDLALNPKEWFACCDTDFGGELDRYEVVEALGTVLPITRSRLTKVLATHWHQWDPDGDGTIAMEEFIKPVIGLQAYIINSLATTRREVARKVPPSLDRNPRAWFEHWDRDRNGTLNRDEMRRAMVRSFCVTEFGDPILHRAQEMKDVIEGMWASLGYEDIDELNFEEFARPFGIMDQVLHNDNHCRFFGDDDEVVLL